MSGDATGPGQFRFEALHDGRVRIWRASTLAATLAGNDAARFLDRVEGATPSAAQGLMARATGQYRFGNERGARQIRRGKREP